MYASNYVCLLGCFENPHTRIQTRMHITFKLSTKISAIKYIIKDSGGSLDLTCDHTTEISVALEYT